MKKLPNKIHFCGFDYDIILRDKLEGGDTWGRTQMDDQKIFIESGSKMTLEKQWETLFHEMLHVAFRHTGFLEQISKNEEEAMVRAWSMNIFGILKDNNLLNT